MRPPGCGLLYARRSQLLAASLVGGLVLAGTWGSLFQVGAYDESAIVAAVWRVHLGQIPGRDFPLTLPPLALLPGVLAWAVAAPRLWTLYASAGLSVVLATLVLWWMTPTWKPLPRLALVTAATIPTVADGWLWHSSLTSVVALVYAVAVSQRRLGVASISAGLLALGKANVAWPALLVGAALLPGPTVAGAGFAVLGLTVSGWPGLSMFTRNIVLAQDRFSLPPAVVPPASRPLLAAVVGLTLAVRGKDRRVGFVVAACCGIATNFDLPLHDAPLLLGSLLVLAIPGTSGVVGLVLAGAIHAGMTRARARMVGDFFEDSLTTDIRPGFLEGLHSGPRWQNVVAEVDRAVLLGDRVFLGMRLEILYPQTGKEPLSGLPVWWHAGTSYLRAQRPEVVRAFWQDPPDVAVWLSGDHARVPEEITRGVEACYLHVVGYLTLDVFVPPPDRVCGPARMPK